MGRWLVPAVKRGCCLSTRLRQVINPTFRMFELYNYSLLTAFLVGLAVILARCSPPLTESVSRAVATPARHGHGSTTASIVTIFGRRVRDDFKGEDAVIVGSLPAHVYISENAGPLPESRSTLEHRSCS